MDSGIGEAKASLQAVETAIRSLNLYAGALEDAVGQAYVELIEALLPPSTHVPVEGGVTYETEPAPTGASRHSHPSALYRRFFARLAGEGTGSPGAEDAWQSHLLRRILADENPFSRAAERIPLEKIGAAVREAAAHDLKMLRVLYDFAGPQLRRAIQSREPNVSHLPALEELHPEASGASSSLSGREETALTDEFRSEERWESLLPELAGFIHRSGLGVFRESAAFRWEHRGGEGRLRGIEQPDPIHLEDLFAYEKERELLLRNTEQFVAGYAANNVLLYGDRGTGKSSTVKALLHAYADRGLRMVEVQKEHLGDFPQILRLLRGRRERFVLFIDDLSFEEHETHYKDLKALLEGSLEARPENMVLYATSNRRHLVKERHSDRIHKLEDDEIHLNDTTEEKLSLSDRFGLTLTFVAPTQERYLAIVRGMAERRGIPLSDEELRARALAWATQRGGRSGRVARQFIDDLAGALKVQRHDRPERDVS
ncbi:MAG: ATP-binding protein [Armatimonadetes bacterium]|nr:ATP-binding protein [Armatimonadota bacterium]